MNLYQKLIEIRRSVPYLQKANKGHQFEYVSSSQVLGSVREKMDELGVLLITKILDKRVNVREKTTSKGSLTYHYEVEMDMEFIWVNAENPEETIKIPWFSMGNDTGDNSKAVGKSNTYAEKTFLLKQFNIATDKDDPDAFQEKTESYRAPEVANPNDLERLTPLVKEFAELRNVTEPMVHQALGVKDLSKITKPQVDKFIQTLTAWIEKAKKESA